MMTERNAGNEVMTTEEVAQYLRLTVATVYKLARSGDIPAAKVGRNWRFKRSLIDEWFRRQAVLGAPSSNETPTRPA